MTDKIEAFRTITGASAWRSTVDSVLSGAAALPAGTDDFGTYWIEGGHRIREQVADDRLLARFLRLVLPPYTGGPVTLFRGENRERFSAGRIGFAWTQDLDVARMFANGLNAVGSGGLLIRATLDSPAIISGPNAHSRYLGELQFTVDPQCATGIVSVEEFAAGA